MSPFSSVFFMFGFVRLVYKRVMWLPFFGLFKLALAETPTRKPCCWDIFTEFAFVLSRDWSSNGLVNVKVILCDDFKTVLTLSAVRCLKVIWNASFLELFEFLRAFPNTSPRHGFPQFFINMRQLENFPCTSL